LQLLLKTHRTGSVEIIIKKKKKKSTSPVEGIRKQAFPSMAYNIQELAF
jgi:hypothetical protein